MTCEDFDMNKAARTVTFEVDKVMNNPAGQVAEMSEGQVTVAIAAALHKLGESCLTITMEDYERLKGRSVQATICKSDKSVYFKIV